MLTYITLIEGITLYKLSLFSLASFCIITNAFADYSNSLDKKGCWDGLINGYSCVNSEAEWSKHSKGKIISKYTNKCNHRLYVKTCNERNSGTWDCGASGIQPGSTKSWSTSNASGRYEYSAIGSTKPSADWVCADRASSWNNR